MGCETADYLAPLVDDRFPANRDVTVIEMTDTLMAGEGGAAKSVLTQRLMRKGVKLELKSRVTRVDQTAIVYEKDGWYLQSAIRLCRLHLTMFMYWGIVTRSET